MKLSVIYPMLRILHLPIFLLLDNVSLAITVEVISLFIFILVFYFVFNYQHPLHEAILFFALLSHTLSLINYSLHKIFFMPYIFIGQILLLFLYLTCPSFLLYVLQKKYTTLTHEKLNNDLNCCFAFLNFFKESLQPNTPMFKYNRQSIVKTNSTYIKYCSKYIGRINVPTNFIESYNQQLEPLNIDMQIQFLIWLCNQILRNSKELIWIQYLISLKINRNQQHRNNALIIYYLKIRNNFANQSWMQKLNSYIIYQNIIKFWSNYDEVQPLTYFINELQHLNNLKQNIRKLCLQEIQFMHQFGSNKGILTLQHCLIERFQLKIRVQNIVNNIIANHYSNSAEFLYLLILLDIHFHNKNIAFEKKIIKICWWLNRSKDLPKQSEKHPLLLMEGWNDRGKIRRINQTFKKEFSISDKMLQGSKRTISFLFPNTQQNSKHNILFQEKTQYLQPISASHSSYQCYLKRIKQANQIQFHEICKYQVRTFIFLNMNQLNYICELIEIRNQEMVSILLQDYEVIKKDLRLSKPTQTYQIQQLDNKMQMVIIDQFTLRNKDKQAASAQTIAAACLRPKMEIQQLEYWQKMSVLEQNIFNYDWKQVLLITLNKLRIPLFIIVIIIIFYISISVCNQIFKGINEQHGRVNIINNKYRLLLEPKIVSVTLFRQLLIRGNIPTQICSQTGIINMNKYMGTRMRQNLLQSFTIVQQLFILRKFKLIRLQMMNLFNIKLYQFPQVQIVLTFQQYITSLKSFLLHYQKLSIVSQQVPTSLMQIINSSSGSKGTQRLLQFFSSLENSTLNIMIIQLTISILTLLIGMTILFFNLWKIIQEATPLIKVFERFGEDFFKQKVQLARHILAKLNLIMDNKLEYAFLSQGNRIAYRIGNEQYDGTIDEYVKQNEYYRNELGLKDENEDEGKNIVSVRIYEIIAIILFTGLLFGLFIHNIWLTGQYEQQYQNYIKEVSEEGQIQTFMANIINENLMQFARQHNMIFRSEEEHNEVINKTIEDLLLVDQKFLKSIFKTSKFKQTFLQSKCNKSDNINSFCRTYNHGIIQAGLSQIIQQFIKNSVYTQRLSPTVSQYKHILCQNFMLFYNYTQPSIFTTSEIQYLKAQNIINQHFTLNYSLSAFIFIIYATFILFIAFNAQYRVQALRKEILSLTFISKMQLDYTVAPLYNHIYVAIQQNQ